VFCPETAQPSFFDAWKINGRGQAVGNLPLTIHTSFESEDREPILDNVLRPARVAPLRRIYRGKAMRLPSARWALVGLAVVLLVGYGLNRGVLVGSRIETARLSDDYPVPFYKKHCRYLFFSGIQQVWTSAESTREEAEKRSCASLKSEPVIHRRRKPSE
jgi:hypothetical protein